MKVYIATVTYGAVIVPILAEFNPLDITHIVNHSGAKLLFLSNSIWEHIEPEALLKVKGVVGLESKEVLHERSGEEIHRHMRLLKRQVQPTLSQRVFCHRPEVY